MFPSRKLHFFISSTGDLQAERASVQESLRLFEIDGLRFEEWPSMPDDPMEVCLEGVRSSDAVVLLLGSSYGTPDQTGSSGTHQEFRHAWKINLPIFVFLLKAEARDPRQVEFIAEVQRALFRCVEIRSVDELAQGLRVSVAAEFSRRWKHFERHPPESSSPWGEAPAAPPLTILTCGVLSVPENDDADYGHACTCKPPWFWLASVEQDEHGFESAELHVVFLSGQTITTNRRALQ